MKWHTSIPRQLVPAFQQEMVYAEIEFARKNFQQSWRHLERAHILAQRYPCQHTRVHWQMLVFGIKIKDVHEIIGQLPRLLVGGIKSFVGHVPVGNTGGANVPPLQPMEIPRDLALIMQEAKNDH